MQKDHWQQRRYNFLSKHSMLGGELKDECIEQQDYSQSNADQKYTFLFDYD